jgi:hypothetical protein
MSDVNALFLTAARAKFRFPSSVGQLTVEDLWDLPLSGKGANLDNIARSLYRDLKEADGDISFVKPAVKTTAELQAKLDVVKYVIDVKMTERDARDVAEHKAATKQKLLAKLAEKQDKDLDSKSSDEIQAMIDAL